MTTSQESGMQVPRGGNVRLYGSGTGGRVLKWLLSGFAVLGINAVLLYILVDLSALPIPAATLISAEVCTLLRFFVNHHWVFGLRYPTAKECLRFHAANVIAFGTWLVIANVLASIGMHYQLAAIVAQTVATLVRLATDFLWIWRHPNACYREDCKAGTSA